MGITKIIGVADIHIPSSKNKIDELKCVIDNFIEQCKEIVKHENSPENVRIVCCGDIFDDKTSISNEALLMGYWFFSELDKICPTIVIAGNHDLNMLNLGKIDSITPIFEMAEFKQTRYLDMELGYKSGFVKDDNIVWCLYSTFSNFEKPEFMAYKETTDEKDLKYIGLIHGDINGAVTSLNRVTENALHVNLFNGTDFVVAGHIHKRQEIQGNGTTIVYCSSLKQKNFGETISGHGYVLYDVETGAHAFVDTPNPEGGYYKIVINNIDDIINNKEILVNE